MHLLLQKPNHWLRMRRILFICIFLAGSHAYAQQTDSTKQPYHVSGLINITNNGISTIPTFSLGKPAAIFNLSMGQKRLTFEPEFRASLEGKPWMLLLWWRYQIPKTHNFAMRFGAHPALNFKTTTLNVNGVAKEVILTRRYLAYELAPNYYLSKNWTVGIYYLFSHGYEKDAIKNMNYLTFNTAINNIHLSSQYTLRFNPQFYYLHLDKEEGTFLTETVAISKKNCPWSLASIINKRIHANVTGSKNLVWNMTLIYAFHKNYIQQ